MTDRTTAKRVAGEAAVEAIDDESVVGLGSGSTAATAITALGERVAAGLAVRGVPTSWQARQRAREAGIPLTDLDADRVDIAIDGADQVAPTALLKGGGGAHVREKIVDSDAERFLVVVDDSKVVDAIDQPVPLAVLPEARRPVADAIAALGGAAETRMATRRDGPVLTDDGAIVVDAAFGVIDDPAALATELSAIPGVVGHGLFVDAADAVYVGSADGSVAVCDR
ncbi:ribose-5-phosphate isomerase RpiA [Halococcoides cellulosivorans]|uniref:Ribose-5-phosphate isomerase A n=1 Tax=Halococcoides cellulosivorans TaxID=1679096 RepID=A0A2R4X2W8_9EURY|nr:ribose-5-phosphate isomerase RpiA [Halococcoides cellulosivorans]AWB28132.1 ribose 5-phosphate isomerase A [Halococcoides cellulosivorans]